MIGVGFEFKLELNTVKPTPYPSQEGIPEV